MIRGDLAALYQESVLAQWDGYLAVRERLASCIYSLEDAFVLPEDMTVFEALPEALKLPEAEIAALYRPVLQRMSLDLRNNGKAKIGLGDFCDIESIEDTVATHVHRIVSRRLDEHPLIGRVARILAEGHAMSAALHSLTKAREVVAECLRESIKTAEWASPEVEIDGEGITRRRSEKDVIADGLRRLAGANGIDMPTQAPRPCGSLTETLT